MEMKLLDAYDIPWKGLSNGCHDFDFEIDDRFFGEFGDSGIQGGRMKAEVRMEKSAAMLLLHVTIEGEVTVECDRCLGDLRLPVNYTGDLTVKFSDGGLRRGGHVAESGGGEGTAGTIYI